MRVFSIDEANGMVPYLQRTFGRIRADSVEIARLNHLLRLQGDRSMPGSPISDDLPPGLRKLRLARDRKVRRVQEALTTLGEVGVQVKRGDGLVDFLSRKGGRHVLLCWRFGEEAVSHWHELDDTFDSRRAIASPKAFERQFLN